MKEQMINIRPHHGLCIHFFEGKGYSNAFTIHMQEIIELLNRPEQKIYLTDREDEICSCCPNYGERGCTSIEKVNRYDRLVLEKTHLHVGQVLPFETFYLAVERDIITPGKMKEICADCGWANICHAD